MKFKKEKIFSAEKSPAVSGGSAIIPKQYQLISPTAISALFTFK